MKSPITMAIFYIVFGFIFVFFAIQQVTTNGWGLFAVALVLLATWDIGSGIRIILFNIKKGKKKSK